MTADGSSGRPAIPVTDWSPLSSAMHAVHERLGRKAAEQLAVITKSDLRSVKRHFARGGSRRLPNGPAIARMLIHPVTARALLEELTDALPADEHHAYWSVIAEAVGIQILRKKVVLKQL